MCNTKWELSEAVQLIRTEVEPAASAQGLHVCLLGSCLYQEQPAKDLDLYVIGHDNAPITGSEIVALAKQLGYEIMTMKAFDQHRAVIKVQREGKKIDLIY